MLGGKILVYSFMELQIEESEIQIENRYPKWAVGTAITSDIKHHIIVV